MNKRKSLFDVTEHYCYGCCDLSYDITKPFVKGYCLWFGEDVEVVLHKGIFMHKRLDKCYGGSPKSTPQEH